MRFFAKAKTETTMAALTIASLIAAGLQAGLGAYNSYRSGQLMNRYRDSLQSRMALNDAKIAAADNTRLTPAGQAYLTAAQQQLKDQTDSLKGIAAVNGGGLDAAKANSAYNKTLGNLVSDLYSKDYSKKQHRLNALEGYGNSLYNSYLNSISQQSAQNAAAASQLYSGAVKTAVGAFDPSDMNKTQKSDFSTEEILELKPKNGYAIP